MQNRFYFGDDSQPTSQTPTTYSADDNDNEHDENEEEDDDDVDEEYDFDTTSLPFPKPLSRPTFTTPSFEPHAFLATHSASNRFQTLEDLQTELRELSATVNRELVDLVNANYEEFVNLGVDLRGGDEKVEEVRVGLLGFERDVAALREKVVARRAEFEELIGKKRAIRKEIGIGRGLLEVDERVEDLERRVGVMSGARRKSLREVDERGSVQLSKQEGRGGGHDDRDGDGDGETWSDGWDGDSVEESDDEYNDDDDGVSGRVKGLVARFLILTLLVQKYDPAHPFLVSQRERINKVRDRVKIEIETATKSSEDSAIKGRLLELSRRLD